MSEAPACDLADGEAPCLYRDTALLHTKRLLAGTSKQEFIDTNIPDTLHLAWRCSSVHHGAISVGIKPAHAVERTRKSPYVQNVTRLNDLPQPGARSRSSTAQHAYLSRRSSRVRRPSSPPSACFSPDTTRPRALIVNFADSTHSLRCPTWRVSSTDGIRGGF